jgi:hypothetical protein
MSKPSSAGRSTERRGFRELAAVLLVIPLAAVIWLVLGQARDPGGTLAKAPEVEHESSPPAQHRGPGPAGDEPEAAEPEATGHEPDLTLASAHSEFKPGDPSHPMGPERRRAYRQNDFIGQIDGAILVKDYQGIRRLNAEYRREYPDDDQMTREAYEMIADCLEKKTPELVERARKFWETQRGSRARRDLRKICLE